MNDRNPTIRPGTGETNLNRLSTNTKDSITGDFLEFEMDTIDRIEIEETPEIIHHSGTAQNQTDTEEDS